MTNGYIKPNDIKKIKKGFIFIDDFNDFKARVGGKKISFLGWIKEYVKADCKLTLGRHDIKPMFSYLNGRAKNKLKKMLKSHMTN